MRPLDVPGDHIKYSEFVWHRQTCMSAGNDRNTHLTQCWQAIGIILNISHLHLLLASLPTLSSFSFEPLILMDVGAGNCGRKTLFHPSLFFFCLEQRDEDCSCVRVSNISLSVKEMSWFSRSKTVKSRLLDKMLLWRMSHFKVFFGSKVRELNILRCVTPRCWQFYNKIINICSYHN